MSRLFLSFFLLLVSVNVNAETITAIADGNWNNTAVWNLGRLPASGDNIIIPASRTITIPFGYGVNLTGPEVTELQVLGNLDFTISDITIDSDDGDQIVIGPSGSIIPNGAIYFDARFNDPFFVTFLTGAVDGPATIANGVLPIELFSFDTKVNKNNIELIWATASETNNDYFVVQRSMDGLNYSDIKMIKGAGNSSERREYAFKDMNPNYGRAYYRLKQVDFDGQSETFAPVAVEFTSLQSTDLMFSNPVRQGGEVTIYSNANSDEILKLTVIDMLGKKIIEHEFSGVSYSFQLDANMKPGIYFVKVSSGSSEKTGRLMVK